MDEDAASLLEVMYDGSGVGSGIVCNAATAAQDAQKKIKKLKKQMQRERGEGRRAGQRTRARGGGSCGRDEDAGRSFC